MGVENKRTGDSKLNNIPASYNIEPVTVLLASLSTYMYVVSNTL